jgi:hypothetical protein
MHQEVTSEFILKAITARTPFVAVPQAIVSMSFLEERSQGSSEKGWTPPI